MNFDEHEPQPLREERFAAERAARRTARKSAALDLRGAHVGAAVATIALAALAWSGHPLALGVVAALLLFVFATALTWTYADGDHARHALQRAYGITFAWGNGF